VSGLKRIPNFPYPFVRVTSNWLNERKLAAWSKALSIPGRDPAVERWDADLHVIRWAEYGLFTDGGWEIDHVVPVELGGTDDLTNLRARHWRGNRSDGGLLAAALRVARRSR